MISGTLPASFAAMTAMRFLHLFDIVRIHGTLPEAWSAMTNLKYFFFGAPPLQTPPASHSFKNETGKASLSGTLPASWGAMTNMVQLRVINCHLSGVSEVGGGGGG